MTIVRVFSSLLLAAALLAVASPARAGEELETIELKAKLVEIPSKFPPEDLYDYAYVMQYEVLEGAMKGQKIFVAHFNPRIARKKVKGPAKKWVGGTLRRFKEGDTHQLKLTPKLEKVWKDAVVDEYFATDRKSTRYWCLEANEAD